MNQPSNKVRSLLNQIESGKLISDKIRIAETIMKYPCTIETFLNKGMKYSTVTARISDLMDLGLVKMLSNPLNNYSIFVYVSDPAEQQKCREAIALEKHQAYIKKGLKNGWISMVGDLYSVNVPF